MFRKLVSNLAFSPALVGQLGFYAGRLKKEEATRRVGLIFTALALVVQSFAVFSPPEAANASSPSDMVSGGITSASNFLANYDVNKNNLKDLFTALGITRNDISGTHKGQINSKDGKYYSWGLTSHFSYAQGERTYTVKTASGGTRTFYTRPLKLWDSGSTVQTGSYYDVLIGKATGTGAAHGQWFAIMFRCGNLVLQVIPPAPECPDGTVGNYPNCTPPQCPPGTTGTYPNCNSTATAKCESLKITRIVNDYHLKATATVTGTAKVLGYSFTITKDGKQVKQIDERSIASTYTAIYNQTQPGTYTVTLTVHTSLGDKTAPSCAKSFTIAPPSMCPLNPSLPANSPECQPCPDDSNIWIKDDKCNAQLINTKTAQNITAGNVDATKATAKAGDKIVYTLSIKNFGKAPSDVVISEKLADVLEYATLVDNGGGTYDATAKTLSWPKTNVKAGQQISRMFTIQLLDTIPAMGQGLSDKTSYDCRMDNTFGNMVSIDVDCPTEKVIVEQTVAQLPHTGPRENMLFAAVIFSIVAYFYARSRQMKKEVRLIRRDLNTGTI